MTTENPEFMSDIGLDQSTLESLSIECCGIPSRLVKQGNWQDGELMKVRIAKQYLDHEKDKVSRAISCLVYLWWVEYDMAPEHRCSPVVKNIEATLLEIAGKLPGPSLQ